MSEVTSKSPLFETASRRKYRFETERGIVSTEDLWDMPLSSSNGFNLDSVAKSLNAQVKSSGEESFVKTKTVEDADLNNRFEIVKYVISVKLEEAATAATAAANKAEKARLIDLLDRKKDEALESLTPEEIEAKIAALG